MSRKSTPISQIPRNKPIGRETDEQVSFAQGAQRAAEKFALPQNSATLSTELVSDDDNTIKELLNKFNRIPSSSHIQLPSSQQADESISQHSSQDDTVLAYQPERKKTTVTKQREEDDYEDVDESLIDRVLNTYGSDMQLLLGFFVAYLIAGVIPLHSMFSKYVFAVDRIAFSDVIVRALAGAIVAYFVYFFLAPRQQQPCARKNKNKGDVHMD